MNYVWGEQVGIWNNGFNPHEESAWWSRNVERVQTGCQMEPLRLPLRSGSFVRGIQYCDNFLLDVGSHQHWFRQPLATDHDPIIRHFWMIELFLDVRSTFVGWSFKKFAFRNSNAASSTQYSYNLLTMLLYQHWRGGGSLLETEAPPF